MTLTMPPMNDTAHIACDLGAESGRVMLGQLSNGRVTLEEIHRFPTGAIPIAGSLRWDLMRVYEEIRAGIKRVAGRQIPIASMSTDAWGVDYVLMRRGEPLLGVPFHYRDNRTDGGYERVFAKVKAEEIFAETGIQFMLINSLFQLEADARQRPELLRLAERILGVGDWVNALACGVEAMEESMASTTQLYNPRTRAWSKRLIDGIGIPGHLFPRVVPSGTVLGPMTGILGQEPMLRSCQVVATCTHDTGAAIAAVPAEGEGWAYLSSGTWSLLGVERSSPLITDASRSRNFTNEIGFGGSIRFLKNIVGLWVVQECRRSWADEGAEFAYDTLTEMANASAPLASLINPADPRFGKPGEMPQKIQAYCRETKQRVPEAHGAMVRTALESLAMSYRRQIEELEEVTGEPIRRLHIVGGGSKNQLLNQFAADATGRTVIAGPVEATAIGNVLMQAIALGRLKDLAELRAVVRASFPCVTYEPRDRVSWNDAYQRFRQLP